MSHQVVLRALVKFGRGFHPSPAIFSFQKRTTMIVAFSYHPSMSNTYNHDKKNFDHDDDDMDDKGMNFALGPFVTEAIEETEQIAGDEYPNYRKEHLKRKEKRRMKANYAYGKRASSKVYELIDIIKYRKEMGYR